MIIVKQVNDFSFTIDSINLTNQIQMTYSDKQKYI